MAVVLTGDGKGMFNGIRARLCDFEKHTIWIADGSQSTNVLNI